ncbi:MAG: hypothetical protein WAU58_09640 [Terriglobales bacterium]
MFKVNVLAFAALTAALLCCAPVAQAQVAVGVNIGPAPVCPYGYFDYEPYDCAPYGYYGPDWFVGGVFLGAGPWFHGPHGFFGHVDNRFDPHHGYAGPLPGRGAERFNHFQGNEARDGRGKVGNAGHEAKGEHALPGYRGGGHAAGHGGGRH